MFLNKINVVLLGLSLSFFISCSSLKSDQSKLAKENQRAIAAQDSFKVLQYNIRELDCVKLTNALKDPNSVPQVKDALNIIKKFSPDIVSINELQFDRFQQPNQGCNTPKNKTGLNVQRLAKLLNFEMSASTFMGDANTGQGAIKMNKLEYSTDPNKGRAFADPVNFGLFPGQYSLGFISKFPAKNNFFTRDLKWSDFNTQVDLSAYRYIDYRKDPKGIKKTFDKKVFELFDKNFIDMLVTINQRDVHFILLHTVVGGAFGNEMPENESPNSQRNADELAFLEWYLTGETILNGAPFNDPVISYQTSNGNKVDIRPLNPNSYFVALGDWNTDINQAPDKPGSIVIKRLLNKFQKWHQPKVFTQETWNFKPTTRPGQLDYMIVSNNLEIINSGGYYPNPDRKELGCNITEPKASAGRAIAQYQNKSGQTCFVDVSVEYFQAKTASDHFPIWAELAFKD